MSDPLEVACAKVSNTNSCDMLKTLPSDHPDTNVVLDEGATTLPLCENTSTQTTETLFSPCTRCFATHRALASVVQLVSEHCSKLELHSELASSNWNAQAEVGQLDLAKWSRAYQLDMKSLESSRLLLDKKVTMLVPESCRLKENVNFLENEIQNLQEQIKSLKVTFFGIISDCMPQLCMKSVLVVCAGLYLSMHSSSGYGGSA